MSVFDLLPKKMGKEPCLIYSNETNSPNECRTNDANCCKTEVNLWYLWFLLLFVVIIILWIVMMLIDIIHTHCYTQKESDIELTTGRLQECNNGTRNLMIPEIRVTLLVDQEPEPPSYDLALSAPQLYPDNRIPSYEDVMAAQKKQRLKRLSV